MARYIDADTLIEMLNNKAKTDLEMGLYNHGALTQSFISFVERQPTADVVPRAEVEKIFEDIECALCLRERDHLPFNGKEYVKYFDILLEGDIAELKKKYTEGKEHG